MARPIPTAAAKVGAAADAGRAALDDAEDVFEKTESIIDRWNAYGGIPIRLELGPIFGRTIQGRVVIEFPSKG